MSSHGRGGSLACGVGFTPSLLSDADAAARSRAVEAPPATHTPPVTESLLEAAASSASSRQPRPAPGFSGFRHLLGNNGLIPFKIHGKPVDASPEANDCMRLLMSKLALRMNYDFAFEDILPNASSVLDNPLIPSGYTYLLQLAGHDLVHSTASLAIVGGGSAEIANSRRSGLRLDTIYGDGPDVFPFAYTKDVESAGASASDPRTMLRLGRIKSQQGDVQPSCPLRDIARAVAGNSDSAVLAKPVPLTDPLIADVRNDDHAILSQLTTLFHILHNKLLARIGALNPSVPNRAHSRVQAAYPRFVAVRTAVTLIYRSILRHDLLAKILRKEVYDLYREPTRPRLEPWDGRIPFEFSHAALRFGHAMIRDSYMINSSEFRDTIANLQQSSSRFPAHMPITDQWVVQWSRFFCVGGHDRNFSRRIAPHYAGPLAAQSMFGPIDKFGKTTGLAYLDLLSNAHASLWSVRELMKKIGKIHRFDKLLSLNFDKFWKPELRAWLSDAPFKGDLENRDIEALSDDPPLLLFILFEASREATPPGTRLGTLGSIIVAEVFFGALDADNFLLERDNTTLRSALSELGKQVLQHEDAFNFVPEINSMPELIAFMVDELEVGSEPPPFI